MEKWRLLPECLFLLDFLNAVVYPSISKPIEEVWDNIVVHDVEKAKDNGINGIYRLVSSEDFNREKYGDYQFIKVTQNAINKLLLGKYKTIKDIENDLLEYRKSVDNFEYHQSLIYTVFYYTIQNKDTNQSIENVETIFINN
ncbi:hypothetical protein [Flavobacterium johnsoniae]|jgi:hypothetical protein|uniref:hypothetical protein n=1 Tax=unclassified Flavobacterium TaxID=196869 RepID=UPI000EAE3472